MKVWVPEIPLVPDHPFVPPVAVQLVALVEDHVMTVEPPLVTDAGVAAMVTVGAEGTTALTVMVTLWFTEPVVLVQVNV